MIDNLSHQLKKLDLSENSLGRAAQNLCKILKHTKCQITFLSLEKTKLSDSTVCMLLQSLHKNKNLKSLNLSENNLSDRIVQDLTTLLSLHPNIREIYLRWNKLSPVGGKKIFEYLKADQKLYVLDLSWNSLGLESKLFNRENRLADYICTFLQTNKTLLHLDLSCNKFSLDECKKIAESLKTNQSIYGFHFQGNFGSVDTLGFLNISENEKEDLIGPLLSKKINGVRPLESQDRLARFEEGSDVSDCCWICDNWAEIEFEFPGDRANDPVFIHFKHEGYKPIYIPEKDGNRTITLMLPNTKLFFFFTSDLEPIVTPEYPLIEFTEQQKVVSIY